MMNQAESRKPLFGQTGFILPKMSGNSMRPLLWSGQHCVIVVPLESEPSIGDMLFFTYSMPDGSKRNIVHRLVEVREVEGERQYITRGDNCLSCELVGREEIIGRVAEVHRLSGYRPYHIIPAKQFTVNNRTYKAYTRLWLATWNMRRFCYCVRARIEKILGR